MSEISGVLENAADNTAGFFRLSAESLAVLYFLLAQGENLSLWLDYEDEVLTETDVDEIDRLIGVATYEVMNPVIEVFPESFYKDAITSELISGTGLTRQVNTAALMCHYVFVAPSAINNSLRIRFFGRKGNWEISVLGSTNNALGITKMYEQVTTLNGDMDWYSSVAAANVIRVANIQLAADGEHLIDFVSSTKNAASSNYGYNFQAVWGKRVGA